VSKSFLDHDVAAMTLQVSSVLSSPELLQL
jgi:hypothetical protein